MDDTISSFWGPVTSEKELCEKNYTHSSYIAEFYNTISNFPCIILALIGLINAIRQRFEKRFSVLHMSNMILAIGSMIFHATLQHVHFGGINWNVIFDSYFANAFLMFCRAQQLGWEPSLAHILGLLPYVKIRKPKKEE